MKYKFKSKRVKGEIKNVNQPTYDNIITINKTDFTLTGWMNNASSNIDYTLEKITQERLSKNKFLREEYNKYNNIKKGGLYALDMSKDND